MNTPAPADEIRISQLTLGHAQDIARWRYQCPYDCYDMTGVEPEALLDPGLGFYAVLAGEELIGFRSFGQDGHVPGWTYDDTALDTGGGLRPQLTGQGFGRHAISAGLAFGRAEFAPAAFRVTVASFNTRALHTVEALGFEPVGRFHATHDGRPYDVLVRVEAPQAP